jgi:hypothetical protein
VPAGPVGNCRVGSLVGPGTVAIAGGLSKTFAFGEKLRMKMESTFTNLPNHLNYAPPSTDVTSSTFGKITSVQAAENAGNRTGQLALRIEFQHSGEKLGGKRKGTSFHEATLRAFKHTEAALKCFKQGNRAPSASRDLSSPHPRESWVVFSAHSRVFGEGLRARTMYGIHKSSTFTANG